MLGMAICSSCRDCHLTPLSNLQKKEESRPEELGLVNMKGIFIVLTFGCILAFIYGCIEKTIIIFKEAKQRGVSIPSYSYDSWRLNFLSLFPVFIPGRISIRTSIFTKILQEYQTDRSKSHVNFTTIESIDWIESFQVTYSWYPSRNDESGSRSLASVIYF